MNPSLPDYDEINDALQGLSPHFDAAELHGQLCGLLCTQDGLQLEDWLSLSLPEHDATTLSARVYELFQALLESSQAGLSSEDFAFQLLLPDDTAGLAARIEALGNWCQGFLLGISHAGVSDIQALPGELPEIVKDFLNISQAETPIWSWWSMCASGCSCSTKNYGASRRLGRSRPAAIFIRTPLI